MGDFKELLSQTKNQIKEVSVQEVNDKLNPDNGFTLLDVREADEWEQGHLNKAIFLPRGFLEVKADKMLADKNEPIVVYCAGGTRSAFAAKTLQDLGYSRVYSMRGGFTEWKNNGLPFVTPEKVGKDKMARYSRHLRIPEVGEQGQLKLLKSKVLLVGAGGLGSPAGVYLAASGVGTIGLVDYDVARRNRRAVDRSDYCGRTADAVRLLVLSHVTEAERPIRVPDGVARGDRREGQCAGQGRVDRVGVLTVTRNCRRDLVVLVRRVVRRDREGGAAATGTSDVRVLVVALWVDAVAGRADDEVTVEPVDPSGLSGRDLDVVGEGREVAWGDHGLRVGRVGG